MPQYGNEREMLKEFITKYEDATMASDNIFNKLKYMTRMQQVANRQERIINIEVADLQTHFAATRNSGLVDRIQCNTQRYIKLFGDVIQENMPPPSIEIGEHQFTT